jgi:hypothetical protein
MTHLFIGYIGEAVTRRGVTAKTVRRLKYILKREWEQSDTTETSSETGFLQGSLVNDDISGTYLLL